MTWNRTLLLLVAAGTTFAACNTLGGGDWLDFLSDKSKGRNDFDGARQGDWCHYHDAAKTKPKGRGRYDDDARAGLWSYWYESGSPEWRGSFAGDQIDGFQNFWHENGAMRAQGGYSDGLESGLWLFWDPDGALTKVAGYKDGVETLRTARYDAEGSISSQGYRLDGRLAGPQWQGASLSVTAGMPDDLKLVRDMWSETAVKREGYLKNGRPDGLWVMWHENGTPSVAGFMDDGRPTGDWAAWTEDGALLGTGPVKGSRATGDWMLGTTMTMQAFILGNPDPYELPAVPDQSEDELAALQRSVEKLLVDMTASATPATFDASLARVDPGTRISAPDEPAPPAIPAGGPTEVELTLTEDLERRFRTYPKTGSGGQYDGTNPAEGESQRDDVISNSLLGKKLPYTLVEGSNGYEKDLDEFIGKKVMLVILRGTNVDPCVYCRAQTSVIADRFKDFQDRDVEVVVVVPGGRGRRDEFIDLYKKYKEIETEPIPYEIACDHYGMVAKFGISANMAKPTTILLDEEGIVRYAFVGRMKQDRPSVQEVLDFIDGMN